ncbi:MAG TPA: hypothetical protein DDW88_02205 [Treponema sp.]|nr:hypothetical protein [Treponema sp.]
MVIRINKFICLILMCFSFSILNAAGKSEMEILRDNGFSEMYLFPLQGNHRPALFLDKYSFIKQGSNGISIFNVKNGEEKSLVAINDINKWYLEIYGVDNGVMYYSLQDSSILKLYEYNFNENQSKEIYTVTPNNGKRKRTKLSLFDVKTKQLFIIEFMNLNTLLCYDVSSKSKLKKEIILEGSKSIYYAYSSPMQFILSDENEGLRKYYKLTSENGQIVNLFSIATIEKHNFNNVIKSYAHYGKWFHIKDNIFLAVDTNHYKKYDLDLIDCEKNIILKEILNDVDFLIGKLYKINEVEYCMTVYTTKGNKVVFCYFTLDIWGL